VTDVSVSENREAKYKINARIMYPVLTPHFKNRKDTHIIISDPENLMINLIYLTNPREDKP